MSYRSACVSEYSLMHVYSVINCQHMTPWTDWLRFEIVFYLQTFLPLKRALLPLSNYPSIVCTYSVLLRSWELECNSSSHLRWNTPRTGHQSITGSSLWFDHYFYPVHGPALGKAVHQLLFALMNVYFYLYKTQQNPLWNWIMWIFLTIITEQIQINCFVLHSFV